MCRPPSLACCAPSGARCLSVAPHPLMPQGALTDGVTSFQKWSRSIETRHLERCRFPAQRRRLDGANLFRIRRVQATEIPAVRLNSLRKLPGRQFSDRKLQGNFTGHLMDFRGGNRCVSRGKRTLLKAVTRTAMSDSSRTMPAFYGALHGAAPRTPGTRTWPGVAAPARHRWASPAPSGL